MPPATMLDVEESAISESVTWGSESPALPFEELYQVETINGGWLMECGVNDGRFLIKYAAAARR